MNETENCDKTVRKYGKWIRKDEIGLGGNATEVRDNDRKLLKTKNLQF